MRLRRLSLAEIARRRADAARDADLLASGWRPTAAQLADAPFIDQWSETTYPGTGEPAVYGRVTGHPLLGAGPAITSPIIAQGPGWIRTEGRFYRIGARRADPPADPVEELVAAWSAPEPEASANPDEPGSSGFVGF
ncbi:hypothetical protein MMSR116_16170 [Methylobacterium mesophilicum SR1.6/6]|uniref:Uncharacterized protein n=1 Tax=Methylobacterium mesophilicum SR1.6/6 TaxID=908290 RepID=A0A6B9FQD9_9HYPH|nr:DUF6634 family protein [Methylobacterium mesophilicum]QGY03248.1 hypothetical protein MMSR116_16170 [Methylobacterium mesophilicum SR1.6/6]